MDKKDIEEILNTSLKTGADFSEIFLEKTLIKKYVYLNDKIDEITTNYLDGIGIRIALEKNSYYCHTNNLDKANLNILVNDITSNIDTKIKYKNIKLNDFVMYNHDIMVAHDNLSDDLKKDFLNKFNFAIKKENNNIEQVRIILYEYDQNVNIANHTGLYVGENRILTRVIVDVVAKKDQNSINVIKLYGKAIGYELLDDIDILEEAKKIGKEVDNKLKAKPCFGGEMPVVIESGFGAVIFHEACGHAMEATSVADNLSVLSGKINEKIANSKVNIIDNGSIDKEWGSTIIDDEGMETQKNILIENGILKNYLIDELNNRKLKMQPTGSSRRENYHFTPTSRMNNTYLKPGNDNIESMIKSIDFGLYAKSLSGGSVDTNTGEFNFFVDEAYMIENGKITYCVKGASLIGSTLEILNNVEAVSNNLSFHSAFCGSISGWVPVTVGQPTIKVSKILVGGEKNAK